MRVVVVNGSPHAPAGTTGELVDELIERWRLRGHSLEVDTIYGSSAGLGPACMGCMSCIIDGEQTCPLVGIARPMEALLVAADVVVFATPIHSFQISAPMKRFIDQFAYLMERPRMFDGTAVLLSTAGGAGHEPALDYLESIVRRWGFSVAGRLGVDGPALTQPTYRAKVDSALDELAMTSTAMSQRAQPLPPSVRDLIAFRMVRLQIERTSRESPADKAYWLERGWFDAEYFVPGRVVWWRRWVANRVEAKVRRTIERDGGRVVR